MNKALIATIVILFCIVLEQARVNMNTFELAVTATGQLGRSVEQTEKAVASFDSCRLVLRRYYDNLGIDKEFEI